MSEYEDFIGNVKKNLARKRRFNKKKKQAILKAIEEKYTNSGLFTPVSQIIEDTENIRNLLHARTNCFGPKEGFPNIDDIPREDRVPALRKCYEDCPVFPQRATINPLNERGLFGRTPLHEAVISENRKAVSKLIHQGANTYKKDNNGHTPLMLAKFNEQDDMVEFLEDLGIEE